MSQISSFHVCNNLDSCLEHLKHDDNYDLAIGGSRQRILNSRFYSPSEIFCFDERIAGYQSTLLMKNDFALTSEVNRVIRHAFEGGLFDKWHRDIQIKKREEKVYPTNGLSMRDYAVAFVFLIGAGNILALLSFCTELLSFRKMKQQSKSKLWKLLATFFDGKRYYLKNLPNEWFGDASKASKNG